MTCSWGGDNKNWQIPFSQRLTTWWFELWLMHILTSDWINVFVSFGLFATDEIKELPLKIFQKVQKKKSAISSHHISVK